jgi:hypothetical protein
MTEKEHHVVAYPAPYQPRQMAAEPVEMTPWRYSSAMTSIIVVSTLAIYVFPA